MMDKKNLLVNPFHIDASKLVLFLCVLQFSRGEVSLEPPR